MVSLGRSDHCNPAPPFLANYNRLRHLYQEQVCPQVSVPYWRVVKPYVPAVLIDNWADERLKYTRENYHHNSTYRHDYRPFCSTVNVAVRRRGKLNNEAGLPQELLFHHTGPQHRNNSITWYDEQFNKRDRGPCQCFPAERRWSLSQMSTWIPEPTDYPLQGEPTNWGLLERMQQRWALQVEEQGDRRIPDYTTVYGKSYNHTHPPTAYELTRYATPMARSFSNNLTDKINKNTAYPRSNQPEVLPTARPGMTPGVCEPRHPPAILHS